MRALIGEAMRRAAVAWVGLPGREPSVVWCLWSDGALYVVSGGDEQSAPGLADADTATVTVRGDHGGAIVTWPATVSRVDPDSEAWTTVAPALAAKRLNGAPAAQLVGSWVWSATVSRLVPAELSTVE